MERIEQLTSNYSLYLLSPHKTVDYQTLIKGRNRVENLPKYSKKGRKKGRKSGYQKRGHK